MIADSWCTKFPRVQGAACYRSPPAVAQQTDGTGQARTRTVIHCDNYCPASSQSTLHGSHPPAAHGLRYDRYVSAASECCCRWGVV
ncbi:hypothetical protein E2C01_086844 [Portunus trituberculatus]|uniref:Uncharacterized protein n=1 Tax=Portunus trituberculatus TaxID=210409 RepID=A0A5B7JCI1_PORTR|nr:hypothetical protein [Portunus trituberculatus]